MASKSPKRKGALLQAKEYLRINPNASNAQVVEALSVSPATVSAARSFLVQTGQIPRSVYDRTSAPIELPDEPAPGSIPVSGVEELERAAAARSAISDLTHGDTGMPLTPEQQRQRLSAAASRARLAGNDALEISAIQALARLDAQVGARDRLGPGTPLTDEDKIHRLSLMLQACGKRLTRKAWERAFGEQFTPQDQPQDRLEHRGLGECAPETPLPEAKDDSPDHETRSGEREEGKSGD